MIVISTDFGLEGPYVGQMKAVLARRAPGHPVIDLFSDLPPFDVRAAAYLIAAYAQAFEPETIFLCVVDPGVGGDRAPIAIKADGKWFVGPDNGLFEPVLRRAAAHQAYRIDERRYGPLSASFHGRDLFAPFAADLATGHRPDKALAPGGVVRRANWPDDDPAIVYIDRFGNAMTGLRGEAVAEDRRLEIGGAMVARARTFSDVPQGAPFYYVNANGLIEIAVNKGRASDLPGVEIGAPLTLV